MTPRKLALSDTITISLLGSVIYLHKNARQHVCVLRSLKLILVLKQKQGICAHDQWFENSVLIHYCCFPWMRPALMFACTCTDFSFRHFLSGSIFLFPFFGLYLYFLLWKRFVFAHLLNREAYKLIFHKKRWGHEKQAKLTYPYFC